MKKILVLTLVVLFATVGMVHAAKFPKRDITDSVVWGAGGGTDQCNRIITAEMMKFMDVNINVINKTGGVAGSVGMAYAYSQKHDGYTLCGLSESNVTAGVQGGWDKRMDVWTYYVVGGSPDIISVNAKTPYKTLKDLVTAAKAKPKSVKAAASGAGSIHHLNLLAVEKGSGVKFNYIPYKGSAPSQDACMKGEVDVVVTSLAEQQQLLRGKKIRALGMLIPQSFIVADLGTIPSAFDAYPDLAKHLPISQSIGFAYPTDVPKKAIKYVEGVFKKGMATDAMKAWGKKIRALGMLIPQSFIVADLGTIPSAFDAYPDLAKHLPISQSIGFAYPTDVPKKAIKYVEGVFKKGMATDAMKAWGKKNYYLLSGKTGDAASKEFAMLESLFTWTLWDLKAAKVNPESLKIPKP